MANRFIAQSGGLTSGDCSTLGTAGTLAYVMGSTGPVVAGDDVYWCAGVNGASYDITSVTQLLVRFQATGTATAKINVYGANSSGVRGITKPELKATGTWATSISFFVIGTDAAAAPLRHARWWDIDWNANDLSYNVINNSGLLTTGTGTNTTAYYHDFMGCRFRGAKHNGVSLFTGGVGTEVDDSFNFADCEISGCGVVSGGAALIGRGANAATFNMHNCTIFGNETGPNLLGTNTAKRFRAVGCTFRDSINGQGFSISSGMIADFYNCTFSGNSNSGLAIAYSANHRVEHCRFIDNGGPGIADGVWDGTQIGSPYNRNAYSGNLANFENANTDHITPPGVGNIFGERFPPLRTRERR